MSIIHMDGFDEYASAADITQEYTYGNEPNFSTSAGRYGGGCVQFNTNNNQYCMKALGATYTELWTGCAFYQNTTGNNSGIALFGLNSSAGTEMELAINGATGQLLAYCGPNSTLLGSTSNGVIPYQVWCWIEFHVVFSGSVGVVDVYVNGTQVMHLTGQNTIHNSGQTGVNSVSLGCAVSQYSVSGYCDDWYILDPNTSPNTARLGDSRIKTLVPASDAGPNNGTPSSGSTHYAMVDEAQWSSTNSLTITNTSGQEELFGMGSLGATPSSVWAVRVLAVAEKTDAGSCNLETVMSSGGNVATGPSTPLLTSYSHVTGIFQTDPNTSAAWTYGGVNAMDCGVKIP